MLPKPYKNAIIYEDDKLYACLANDSICRGHSVVVWKENAEDLHSLNRTDYLHLMKKVNDIRNAMMKALQVEKVYLIYMDEAKQVHWHLVPRYETKGYDLLTGKKHKLDDFQVDDEIRKCLK